MGRQSRTALFTASDYSIASCLLASKAEIDPRDNELRTPFFDAAARGDRALLHALVEAGCESNARDASGQTALFGAAASAPLDVVRLLISLAGVDPSVKDDKGQLVERAAKKMKPQPQAGVLEYLTRVTKGITARASKPQSRYVLAFFDPIQGKNVALPSVDYTGAVDMVEDKFPWMKSPAVTIS